MGILLNPIPEGDIFAIIYESCMIFSRQIEPLGYFQAQGEGNRGLPSGNNRRISLVSEVSLVAGDVGISGSPFVEAEEKLIFANIDQIVSFEVGDEFGSIASV
jgi:hypothetical protein